MVHEIDTPGATGRHVPISTSADRTLNDRELLARFLAGDRDALGQLFQRHAGAAYRIARRFLKDSHEAEDAVQAAFLNVMQHARTFQGRSEVKTWLISSVINACRTKIRADQRRKSRDRNGAAESGVVVPPKISHDEMIEAALKGIEALPETYRLPVWMRYCEGLSFSEIAAALVVSESAARQHTHHGLELLRGALAGVSIAATSAALVAALASAPVEAAPATLSLALTKLAASPLTIAAPLAAKSALLKSALALKAAAAIAVTGVVITLFAFSTPKSRNPAPTIAPAPIAKPIPDDPPPKPDAPAPSDAIALSIRATPSPNLEALLKQEIAIHLTHHFLNEALDEIRLKLPRQARISMAATDAAARTDWHGVNFESQKISVAELLKTLADSLHINFIPRGDRVLFWRDMPVDQRTRYRLQMLDKTQPEFTRREAALDLLKSGDVNAVGDVVLAVLSREDMELTADIFQEVRRTLGAGLTDNPLGGTPCELLAENDRIKSAARSWLFGEAFPTSDFATPAMLRDFNMRLAAILNLPDYLLAMPLNAADNNAAYFWALEYIGDNRCTDKLAEFMSPLTRNGTSAALALGALGDPRALPVLKAITEVAGDDPLAPADAAQRLKNYNDPTLGAHLFKLMLRDNSLCAAEAATSLGERGNAAVLNLLLPFLTDQTPQDKAYRAMRALAGLRDPLATKILIKALEEPHLPEMGTVVAALSKTRDPAAIAPLIADALDPQTHPSIRQNALDALVGMRSPEAIGQLVAEARHNQPEAVEAALFMALGQSHDPRADEFLASTLSTSKVEQTRRNAVEALAHTRSETGLAALFSAAKDANDIVRVFAHGSLENIDCDAARDYLCDAHLHRMPLLEIVANCSRLPSLDAEKRRAYNAHLRDMAEKADVVVCGVMLRGLAHDLGSQATRELLERKLSDPNEYLRRHVADIALTHEETFVSALKIMLDPRYPGANLRKRAASIYLFANDFDVSFPDEIRRRQAIEILRTTAEKDPDPVVRLAAVYSLNRDIKNPETVQSLRALLAKEIAPIVRHGINVVLTDELQLGTAFRELEHPEQIKLRKPDATRQEF